MNKGNNERALFLVACMVMAACGTVEPREPEPETPETPNADAKADEGGATRTQKPGAPVKVEGKLSGSSAALSIDFGETATDVTVEVWGVDGLVVTSEKAPIKDRRVSRGDRLDVEVSFTAPATRADLAVRVRGTFEGRVRERVQSFTVNAGAPSLTQPPGEVRTGPDGKPVRVMRPE